MPTYVCHVPPRHLTDNQKRLIAHAIAKRHHEATGAPEFFVQVEIDESEARTRFLGGAPSNTHIWIRADIRSGRSEAVRQRLMLGIMHDVSDITNIATRDIWIYLCNIDATDMVEFGHVLPAPGKEQEWFDALPKALQHYLENLGAPKTGFEL
jgi:phenylpyruvate tautomerase PptA (4-oxalocrotonate tautomerase family)